MEPTVLQTTKVLTKEDLRDANCCRLCGIQTSSEDPFAISFIPIFETSDFSLKLNELLADLINRWLPFKINKDDRYYPRCICSRCFYRVDETIKFFTEVLQGQRKLADIINKSPAAASSVDLQYSDDNPGFQAPRRRGRPKKDPNQPKIDKPKDPVLVESPMFVDGKRKRATKPPSRFGEGFDPIKEEANEDLSLKAEAETGNTDGFIAFSATVPEKIGSNESSLPKAQEFISSVRHIGNSMLDIGKLDIIMDGDEEETPFVFTLEVDPALETPSTTKTKSESAPVQTAQEEVVVPTYKSDSDTSVKTIDFVPGRKSVKKRGGKRRSLNFKSKQEFKCTFPDCSKTFRYRTSRTYHIQREHEKIIRFHCEVCNRGFTHEKLLKLHQFTHSEERNFKCNQCLATFKARSNLFTHLKNVHEKLREFKCSLCPSVFSLRSTLKSHLLLHEDRKPYQCTFCEKTFRQDSNLKAHERIHTGYRPYKCDFPECEKNFTTSSQLKVHKTTHTEEKEHLCPTCGKGFSAMSNFKHHMRGHTGDRPYKCIHCDKTFITPWAQHKHMKLHTHARPYKCTFCVRAFADRSNLNKHKKAHARQGQIHSDGAGVTEQVDENTTANVSEVIEISEPNANGALEFLENRQILHLLDGSTFINTSEQDTTGEVLYLDPILLTMDDSTGPIEYVELEYPS